MVSTVSTRPSHYELLGLTPSASGEDIARAFAREMGRPRAFGAIADISIAYEVLRDPARRRAYDETLGLTPKPKPKPVPVLSSSGVGGAAFLARPAEQAARPDIAAALRELARPEPLHDPVPPARPSPPPPVAERVQLEIDPGAETAGAIPWKPVALAAGGLALAVAGLGAWAGWDGAGAQAARATAATRVALPPPTTFTVDDPAAAAAARVLDEPRAPESKRAERAASRVVRTRPVARPALAEVAANPQADPLAAQPDAAAPLSEPAVAAAPAAASLPLPKAVIARTIGRIGYPCGAVASASASGAPGVFTVTCTSGHSYRAAPVHGRYHFRRLAGR